MKKSIIAIGLQNENKDVMTTFTFYNDVVYLREDYNTEVDGDRERAIEKIKHDASIFIGMDHNKLANWVFVDGNKLPMSLNLSIG